ncbi:MAG: 50S ribosomal protein L11 methyltransferase [Reichenbachiella sp.]
MAKDQLIKFDDFYGMLSDKVRTDAYKSAIEATVKPGDIVIDLGAGTGILGIMALQAGAATVYMIEKSDAIELAKAVVHQNGFSDQVVFINNSSLEATINEKADVIISETLGNFGLDENTLEFIIDARDRFLKPNGKLIPENISLKLTPVESKSNFDKLEFWKDIHGIDFSPAYHIFSSKMMVTDIKPEEYLAIPIEFAHIDFYDIDKPIIFNKTYHAINREGSILGFAGWFEATLIDGVKISTSPEDLPTHWKQAFFPIQEAIPVVEKDLLEISMIIGALEDQSDNTSIKYEYRCTQRTRTTSTE